MDLEEVRVPLPPPGIGHCLYIFSLQTVAAGLMVVKVIPAEAAPRYTMAYSGVFILCIAGTNQNEYLADFMS